MLRHRHRRAYCVALPEDDFVKARNIKAAKALRVVAQTACDCACTCNNPVKDPARHDEGCLVHMVREEIRIVRLIADELDKTEAERLGSTYGCERGSEDPGQVRRQQNHTSTSQGQST